MAGVGADRDLLFGILALQNGLVDQVQLVAAFQAWTRDRARTLADHLVDRGDLDGDDRAAVDALAGRHLKRHGDPEKSLAALAVGASTRESLAGLGDPEVGATLSRLGPGPGPVAGLESTVGGDDGTATYAAGAAASAGLRFRVLRPHARGGIGAVFVALDEELHREVALKQMLDRHADDPVSRARFVREAEITGGLEHPGIVPVYGLGAYADGRPYYAMRFVRGDNLKEAVAAFHADERLKADPGARSLALRTLLRRFTDVCNAVDYAHSRGVLHRDLKPGNVIVGKHGETLVVDWGLAKAAGAGAAEEPGAAGDERPMAASSAAGGSETLPGSALGTPAYMSPEQAAGDLDRLGPRSDVYSLGATLYCLLTGKPPSEDDAVLRAARKGEFPPPRAADPSVDRALEAVCLKAMSLKPEGRYPTARALADDVERWAADEPVSAWREPFGRRARRWARRRRAAVTAAAAAVIVALAGTAAVLAVQTRANRDLKAANAALAAAKDREAARFDLARDAIRLFHGEVSEDLLLKEERFQGLRTKLLRGAADFYGKLEALLKGQTDRASRAALGQAYFELGDLTARIGDQSAALAVHRKALAVRRRLAAEPGSGAGAALDVARSLNAAGWLSLETGDTPGARAAFEEAEGRAALMERGDEVRSVLADSDNGIGAVLGRTGRMAEALAALGRALAIREALAEANPAVTRFRRELARSHNDIGFVMGRTGRQGEALAAFGRALAIQQALAGSDPAAAQYRSDLARSHNNIGAVLEETGRTAEALMAYERALAVRRELAAANPAATRFQSDLAWSHLRIGLVMERTGRPAEALAAYERALAIREALAEANPAVTRFQGDLAISLAKLGATRRRDGRAFEAAASFRRAVTITESLPADQAERLYDLACYRALLAGIAAESSSGLTGAEGRAEADRAVGDLRRAVADGFRDLARIRDDSDLDPLRARPDFQLLMMDLAFPADPFTP